MEEFIFYYNHFLSLKERFAFSLYGLVWVGYLYIIFSDNFKIHNPNGIFILLGVVTVAAVFSQPYIMKKLGLMYVRLSSRGLSWKLKLIDSEHHVSPCEIEWIKIHPISLEVCLNDEENHYINFPYPYKLVQEFRNKIIPWAEELEITWEDWREHQVPV
ncbi:MAG: hypothetical protein P8Y60_16985 [Calditrichota bacterium]